MNSYTICSRHNTPLTYYKVGQGPVIAIVNAYGTANLLWQSVINKLAHQYTLLIWDLRGMEEADKPTSAFEFGVEEHAQDLNEILLTECISKAHIVSWCSGAKVALQFQQNFPAMTQSLLFVSGNFSPFPRNPLLRSEWDEKMLAATDLLMQNPAAQPFFFDAIKTAIEAAMRGDNNVQGGRFGLLKMIRPEYISLILQPMFNETTMVNYLRMINAFYNYEIDALLDNVTAPLCFVWAEDDNISSPEQSRVLSRSLANAIGIPLADSNHYMIIEKPDLIANHIDGFVSAYHASSQ